MEIITLTAENFKRLTVVKITPTGPLIEISGKNRQGKTSVLDAIWAALGGPAAAKKTPRPIRDGAESARIELVLGTKGAVELIVERRFTASGSTLTVKTADGAKYPRPQEFLDDLYGALTFDPLDFMRKDAKGKSAILRELVKLPVDPDVVASLNKDDFAARTIINREVTQKRAAAAAITVPDDLPHRPVDESALMDEMAAAASEATEIERRRTGRAQVATQASDARRQASAHRTEAARLTALADGLDATATEAEQKLANAPPLPEPVDVATIRASLDRAKTVNAQIADRKRKEALEAEASARQAGADKLTAAMDERTAALQAALAAAKMPMPGLTFDPDGNVIFGGVPIEQASDAEQLEISTSIAAALNPKLRIIRIRDGSLLDDEAMERLTVFAKERDMQLWVEKVSSTGVGIVMEDGHVANAEAASAR